MTQQNVRFALVVGWIAVGLTTSAAVAQTQQPAACTGSAYRQFDFWIGSWQVTNPQGSVVGSNTIRRTLGGCVLHESWRGASGSTGQSFNIYNLQTDTWHQSWVDNSGQLLLLDGGLDERGRMRLRGETVGQDGGAVHHEITWEPVAGGQVRQVWRTSTDGGATWRVVFDGLYTRNER